MTLAFDLVDGKGHALSAHCECEEMEAGGIKWRALIFGGETLRKVLSGTAVDKGAAAESIQAEVWRRSVFAWD
jgi:hypothetical protein